MYVIRSSLIILLLSTLSCSKVPLLGPAEEGRLASQAQEDCGFVQNSYGQRISWKGKIPIKLLVHSSFPNEYLDVLKSAASKWEDAAGKTLFQFAQLNGTANLSQKDNLNIITWLQDWDDSKKNQQAVTALYWNGNTITESDLAIDGEFYSYYLDTYQTKQDIHLESLLIHELGHVLGLRHRSDVPTVMWSILNGASERNSLTEADRATIKCEY